WRPPAACVTLGRALGLAGFSAESREPLFIAVVVVAEQFDYRRAAHWASLAVVGTVMLLTGVIWIGIRSPLRAYAEQLSTLSVTERLAYTANMAQTLLNSDDA